MTVVQDDPSALATHIAMFFFNARPEFDFCLKLEYCYLNVDGDRSDLDKVPVLSFYDNHRTKVDIDKEARNRGWVEDVISTYLSNTSEVWAEKKKTFWMLAHENIARSCDDNGNLCPMCVSLSSRQYPS